MLCQTGKSFAFAQKTELTVAETVDLLLRALSDLSARSRQEPASLGIDNRRG